MVSNTFILPSYFGTPFATDIPCSKYDSKGRQLSFVETEVQRLERMALVNASKSRRSCPKAQSSQPSSDENPPLEMLDPTGNFFLDPTSCDNSSSLRPGHKRRSLSSIPEED